jgi:hypothetical protein
LTQRELHVEVQQWKIVLHYHQHTCAGMKP